MGNLAWSPDDTYLIACGPEDCSELWIWNTEVKSANSFIMQTVAVQRVDTVNSLTVKHVHAFTSLMH